MHDLAGLVIHLHLLLGVIVRSHLVNLWDDIICQLMSELIDMLSLTGLDGPNGVDRLTERVVRQVESGQI